MAVKTRLTNSVRDILWQWMMSQYDIKNLHSMDKQRNAAIDVVNKAAREKYPEKDMIVLRKYALTRIDSCVRFANLDTQQFYSINFYGSDYKEMLADVPKNGGYETSVVYPVDQASMTKLETYIDLREKSKELRQKKESDYRSFLFACRNVEDVAEVVPFTEEMRKKYFSGGALIAISDEKIASLKEEFATAA